MIQSSEMTNEEFLRLNGCLSIERIEALIDAQANIPDTDAACVYIEESMGSLYGEDFLVGITDKWRNLVKNLRGNNREEGSLLLAAMEDLQMDLFNEGDYGRGELHNALKALGHVRKVKAKQQ